MEASTWIVVSFVSILEMKEERVLHGMPYKFDLLNQSIIRSLWEIGHNFVLKNPDQVRPVELEIIFMGLQQGRISNIEDPKSQR